MTLSSSPQPKLHTPAELLRNAEKLLNSGDPNYMRSAVLESMATLEAYIQQTVFKLLEIKLDPLFVEWIKEKTKMDLDSRIDPITNLATGVVIDRSSKLWNEYQDAKKIRNKIAHHGRAVTEIEAHRVYNIVRDWLSYLGSNAEVDLSLLGLKEHLESVNLSDITERTAVELIKKYYDKTSPYSTNLLEDAMIKGYRADLILDYGKYKTLFEIKLSKHLFEVALVQLEHLYGKLKEPELYKLVLIQFTPSEIPKAYSAITKINDHTSVLFIKINDENK